MLSSVVFGRERRWVYSLLKVYIATYNMAVFYVSRIVYIKELNIFNEALPSLLKHT